MAQIVKLRRSSVSGQKPTNSNLQLGELALNTTDGKVYMAKSGSLGPTVEELISTNTVNTGSISLTGDISGSIFTGSFKGDGGQLYNIPLSGVTNLVTISGSIDSRLDVLEAYSGSQLVPSSSMSFRTLQTDVYCKNVTGTQINKGTVVRIVGATGDNPLIGVANPSTELASANVLGIATQNIPNDDFGLVITEGVLTGVNTNGMTAGALLYLGTSGTFTTTPPTAPNHGVRLGEVLRVQQNNGSIYVRVDNGIELNEAHDVIYTGITHGDLLVRSGSIWKNSKSLEGNYVVTGSLTLTQNLTVLGSSSLVYVTSSNLAVSASFISVNVFEPAERFGGLKVYDSGSSNATASLAWDSQHNHWVYQNVNGASYSGGMLLSGPRNSGSLGDEPGLIDGRIVKSVGGDHLDVSIISETGTTINIDGNLNATSLTGSIDFNNLTNSPTLVSGSSQIDITGTDGYTTFSSSIATTTNNLEIESGSIRSDFNSFTSSYNTGSFSGSFTGSASSAEKLTITADLITNDEHFVLFSISGSGVEDVTTNTFVRYNPTSERLSVRNLNVTSITGSLTGSMSGSFTGDGIGLYNIPASGVTGLELNKIVSGSVSASIQSDGTFRVNGDTYIDGTITAKEIHIDYITSSVLYQSGSTKFGNSTDDRHEFTGSIHILDVNSHFDILGNNFSETYLQSNGGLILYPTNGSNVQVKGTNLIVDGYVTASSFTGSGVGLFNVPYSGLTGVPTLVSGSSQISYTGITNIPNGIVSGSSQISFNGITDKPTLVSGSSQISYTGITDISNGIVSSSQQVIDLGFVTTGSFESFTSSYTTDSASFDSRINAITGSINDITSSLSNIELFSSSINNFTSSVVLTSQTSSMTVLSSSYALTASYALNGGGGGTEGQTAKLIQTTSSTTWTFVHNLGEQFPAITIFDANDDVVIPTSVNAQDTNTLIITFSSPQTGTATATVGGGLPYISGSYQGRVLAVDNGTPIWKGGILSGSLQLTNIGFATTGSNNFKGDQYVSGSIIIGNSASIGSKCVTISSTTQIVNLSSFDGANFDYVVKNGLNMRAGAIMSAWNGSNSVYNESSTMDLGNTSGITFNVTSLGILNAAVTSGTWTVEVLYRALGCGNLSPTLTPTPTSTPTPTPTPPPVTGSTNYSISTGYTISEPCNGLFGSNQTVYGNAADWLEVTRFYTNSGMTTPFNGYSLYYGDSVASYGTTLQIDSSGYVINSYAC